MGEEGVSTEVYGLRGMYVVAYRQFSALVHGMPESLHRIVGDGPMPGVSRVGIEARPLRTTPSR